MNERIKELWSQAGGHYNSGNQHTWPEYTITDPEKFAELIVRECGIVADQWVNDEDDGTNLVSAKLRQHFGVEE